MSSFSQSYKFHSNIDYHISSTCVLVTSRDLSLRPLGLHFMIKAPLENYWSPACLNRCFSAICL